MKRTASFCVPIATCSPAWTPKTAPPGPVPTGLRLAAPPLVGATVRAGHLDRVGMTRIRDCGPRLRHLRPVARARKLLSFHPAKSVATGSIASCRNHRDSVALSLLSNHKAGCTRDNQHQANEEGRKAVVHLPTRPDRLAIFAPFLFRKDVHIVKTRPPRITG